MKQFQDTLIRGENLLSYGFESKGVLDPLSLLTFGFISQCQAIWVGMTLHISTSWANSDSAISTSWSNSDSVITTTWTAPSGSSWGEC